jgi:hypothetical protein
MLSMIYIYSLCENIQIYYRKIVVGWVHASNYMKQIIIIRQASERVSFLSEWVSYGHPRPKIQRHGTEPSWTSPNFQKNFVSFWCQIFIVTFKHAFMYGMNVYVRHEQMNVFFLSEAEI